MNDTAHIDIIILPLDRSTHTVQDHLLSQSTASLTTEEIRHAESFYHHEDNQRFKMARTLLKYLISSVLNIPIAAFMLRTNRHGKPIYNGMHFSVSKRHCGIVIAASSSPLINVLGIDIEAQDDTHEWAELAKLCMASNELSAINSAQDFYCYWTAKEASVKALGTGLSFPLPLVSVDMARKLIRFQADNNSNHAVPNQPWQLKIHQQSNWTLAIVYDNPLASIHYVLPSVHKNQISFTQHFPLKDNNP